MAHPPWHCRICQTRGRCPDQISQQKGRFAICAGSEDCNVYEARKNALNQRIVLESDLVELNPWLG